MSLAVAVPLGIGAAIAYGAGTAGQHSAAQAEGAAGIRGVLRLVREPRWLLSFGGQTFGFVLQALALGAGPVVLIQPLLVLALPVSLGLNWALGGPRPRQAQYVASAAIVVGLAIFSGMVGDGGAADVPSWWATAAMAGGTLLVGVAIFRVAKDFPAALRAAVYGSVSGVWSGVVGVLLDVVAQVLLDHGVAGFAHPDGLAALVSLVAVGTCSVGSAQLAFQAGPLAASFPAMVVAEPVVAVIFGAALLHERVPVSAAYAVGYAACFALVLLASMRLAEPASNTAAPA